MRGTTIGEGNAIGIVTQVGDATEIGKTTRQATETTENKTPLEQQLNGLADKINIAAFSIASVMFIILNLIHWDWGWGNHPFALSWDLLLTEVRFLMGAIVVIIVAVPEGLPYR